MFQTDSEDRNCLMIAIQNQHKYEPLSQTWLFSITACVENVQVIVMQVVIIK